MKCQRCFRYEIPPTYRVFTEVLEMKVCAACADEAQKLGINVEFLDSGEEKNGAKHFHDHKERTVFTEISLVPTLLAGAAKVFQRK